MNTHRSHRIRIFWSFSLMFSGASRVRSYRVRKEQFAGGRARKFESQGFTFDMGPSWYWMPDVFEEFFGYFGKQTSDYYELVRLDPSYELFIQAQIELDIPAGVENLCTLFDSIEPGSSQQLLKFLDEGKFKYEIGIHDLVHKPGVISH